MFHQCLIVVSVTTSDLCDASLLHPVSAILTFELQSWQSNLTQPLLMVWRRGNGQSEFTATKQAIGAEGNCKPNKLRKSTSGCIQCKSNHYKRRQRLRQIEQHSSLRGSGVSIGFCCRTHRGRRLQECFINASLLCQ